MIGRILLIAALAAACPLAVAGQPHIGCNPDGTQIELNQCAADALTVADAELNTVYRQIMAALPAGSSAKANLRASQRQWIVQRDADLQAQFPLEPGENARLMYGSMYPMLHASAKADLTRARTLWLRRNFLENDG